MPIRRENTNKSWKDSNLPRYCLEFSGSWPLALNSHIGIASLFHVIYVILSLLFASLPSYTILNNFTPSQSTDHWPLTSPIVFPSIQPHHNTIEENDAKLDAMCWAFENADKLSKLPGGHLQQPHHLEVDIGLRFEEGGWVASCKWLGNHKKYLVILNCMYIQKGRIIL